MYLRKTRDREKCWLHLPDMLNTQTRDTIQSECTLEWQEKRKLPPTSVVARGWTGHKTTSPSNIVSVDPAASVWDFWSFVQSSGLWLLLLDWPCNRLVRYLSKCIIGTNTSMIYQKTNFISRLCALKKIMLSFRRCELYTEQTYVITGWTWNYEA